MRSAIAPILAAALLGACAPKSFEKTIKDYGYTPLQPPSTLLKPGTIVFQKNSDPLSVGIVCGPETAIGIDDITKKSQTADIAESLSKTSKFALGADYLDKVKAKAEANAVKNVTLSFTKATVIEVPRDKALEAIDNNRTDYCTAAIEMYQGENKPISMIVSVLKADVVYDVAIDKSAGLSASATKDMLNSLAGALNLESHTVSGNSIQGTGLFWGAQDEVGPAVYGMPQEMGSVEPALRVDVLGKIDPDTVAKPPPPGNTVEAKREGEEGVDDPDGEDGEAVKAQRGEKEGDSVKAQRGEKEGDSVKATREAPKKEE